MSSLNALHRDQPQLAGVAARPTAGDFTDRIMAAIVLESAPTPARTFLSAVRRRSARDAVSTLRVAWHLGTVRRWKIAPAVRVRSMAFVLAVACALGTGSLAAAATLRIAAEPIGQFFQSGVDEQGPTKNQLPGVDAQPDVPDKNPGVNEPGRLDHNQGGQSGTDTSGSNGGGQGGQSGTDTSRSGGDAGQSGSDQPGSNDDQGGQSGTDTSRSNGDAGGSGTDQPGGNGGGSGGQSGTGTSENSDGGSGSNH